MACRELNIGLTSRRGQSMRDIVARALAVAATLTVVAMLTLLATPDAQATETAQAAQASEAPQAAPANPAFQTYLSQLRHRSRATHLGSGGRRLGVVPPPVQVISSTGPHGRVAPRSLPTAFDLRTQGKLTSVRDQGALGTCWAFASNASLESGLLPGELWDFSEDNMALNAGFDADPYNGGGNSWMSAAYLARAGPVAEADDAYADSYAPPTLAPRKHLRDWSLICGGVTRDLDAIKGALMTYGAVSTAICWDPAYYRADTQAFYDSTPGSPSLPGNTHYTNHVVTIVGWDDSYPAANFAVNPGVPGAWIVRNSWGTDWGDQGYFYVSYVDFHAGYYTSVLQAESFATYTTAHQYDPLGWVSNFGYSGGGDAWAGNDFTATSSDPVVAVGLYTVGANTQYQILTGSDHAGALTSQTAGTFTYAGYHTVALPSPVALTVGQPFSVVVRLLTPGTNYPVPVEYAVAGYTSGATASAGQSWISNNGTAGTWTDIGSPGSYTPTNVCLKAFTRPAISDTSAPATQATGVPSGWSRRAVTMSFAATDSSGGWGVHYVEASLDGGSFAQTGQLQVAGNGQHTIVYRAVDKAGNVEGDRTATVRIDGGRPVPTALRKVIVRRGRRATFRFRVADLTPSARVAIRIFRVGKLKRTVRVGTKAANRAQSYRWKCTLAPGKYTWKVYATDLAGNTQRRPAARPLVVR
jgi:C1A family cysteine protease